MIMWRLHWMDIFKKYRHSQKNYNTFVCGRVCSDGDVGGCVAKPLIKCIYQTWCVVKLVATVAHILAKSTHLKLSHCNSG